MLASVEKEAVAKESAFVKVVVMIPAYNEEETIGDVIGEIPREIKGTGKVEILVVEDGSTDGTVEIARKAGADRIISERRRLGLAKAFEKGLEVALGMGADVIVNIDADNQYNPREIPKLVLPIVRGEADVVLGNRQVRQLDHMSSSKKVGNRIATFVTRKLSGLEISDAQTGFRAFSRRAALMLNVLSDYTYTQETIIQAAYKGLAVVEVPVEFRRRDGDSRLISSVLGYAKRAGVTILLTYLNYKPLKTFLMLGFAVLVVGFLFGFRVLVHFLLTGSVTPYLPSAILAAVLVMFGFQVMMMGLFASMVKSNRELTEKLLYRVKEMER